MEMKCDNCIHKQVCKDKPPESYPRVMIDTITENCEYYTNAADVQPVVHAHWICIGDYDEFIFECSNCHDIWRFENGTPRENNVDYCFSCGAKMDSDDTYDKPT